MAALPGSAADARPARADDEARKLGIAACIFLAIVGGYVGIARAHAAIEEARAALPDGGVPTPCTLWFVGSSTMYRWNTLTADMAPWTVRRRGVNGATVPQVVSRFENDPVGPPPAAIVWYAGENDIAAGASGSEAFAEFREFMDAKARRFGKLPVVAISLKPSPARWANLGEQTTYNDALRRYAASRDDLDFVDMRPLLLVGGRPGPFYVDDGIHMNRTGYDRWAARLRISLARVLPIATVRRCLAGRDVA